MNLLSAQYLVQCLDTENVCHHIIKMDLPPRKMKEAIFTSHNQTVLPLLANNRKDTLHALHTSFVNTAIDNMKDNRVLNNRPPPINDEETLLSRLQRTTLSQLRSGHCKLLSSYKKLLKQSDSSSCPDCGMHPQDVPHLFDCTTHPNDLSPVNLWDKSVETIRELSVLDPGSMDWQMRMVEEDIQQQSFVKKANSRFSYTSTKLLHCWCHKDKVISIQQPGR